MRGAPRPATTAIDDSARRRNRTLRGNLVGGSPLPLAPLRRNRHAPPRSTAAPARDPSSADPGADGRRVHAAARGRRVGSRCAGLARHGRGRHRRDRRADPPDPRVHGAAVQRQPVLPCAGRRRSGARSRVARVSGTGIPAFRRTAARGAARDLSQRTRRRRPARDAARAAARGRQLSFRPARHGLDRRAARSRHRLWPA